MREIYSSEVKRSTNCGGTDQVFTRKLFVVEESDVGIEYQHYLGHNHRAHRITPDEVGAVAIRYMRPGYSMWHLLT